VSATENRRITIHTAVAPPSEYPGKPTKGGDAMGGQSFSTLAGAKSSGRRPDGRAFTMGDQGGLVGYHIAWPYRCEPADLCPEAGPWRVLELNVVATFQEKYPFTFWVVAPLPPDARPLSFTSFDTAGRQIDSGPSSPDTRTATPEPGEVAEPGPTT
jgi:hypothetical protein